MPSGDGGLNIKNGGDWKKQKKIYRWWFYRDDIFMASNDTQIKSGSDAKEIQFDLLNIGYYTSKMQAIPIDFWDDPYRNIEIKESK